MAAATTRFRWTPASLGSQLARGFFMGSADVVPGVSGGTIALAFGIYEHLVETIRRLAAAAGRLARGDLRTFASEVRRADWAFLVPVVAGIGIAVVTLARVIERLLDEQPVRMAAVFFGLVAASIVVAWDSLRTRDGPRLAILAAAAAATFVALGFRAGPVADPAWWAVLLSGAAAICAMILPGISGSFILLMLGMYDVALGAVNDRAAGTLALFALGAAGGLGAFAQLLGWLLRRHHDTVMAALIGLMAGSLRVLWPWPAGTAGTTLGAPRGDVWAPVALAVGAAGALVLLARAAGLRAERPPLG